MTTDVGADPDLSISPAFTEIWDAGLGSRDPLSFDGYRVPLPDQESVRTGVVSCGSAQLAVIECLFDHNGGTMGAVAGERIVRAFRRAAERRLPVAALVASGGARLQEGMISLTQMARTSSAVLRHRDAGLMTAAVLRPHTTGGVYASWASLADLLAGEPGATIGFGGPRVVAEVTGSLPPADSHTAESAFRHGLLDALTPPREQWAWLTSALVGPGTPLLVPPGRPNVPDRSPVPSDGWAALLRARGNDRPSGLEWAAWLTDGWVEIRGTDPAMRAGLAMIGCQRAVVVAMDRHAFGDAAARPRPGAFRLAQRALALAERLRLPVLTLVDTPGAEPGPAAEADGIAGEIARTLITMAGLTVPTVAVCVGEGGSGGAMALVHADRFLMLSGSVFSVIGPEAGAAILYHDSGMAPRLARALRITATDLHMLGVVDGVLDESTGHVVDHVRAAVLEALATSEVGDREIRNDRLAKRNLTGDLPPV
jgi:acetyl-CoA carboxylase alpha subunit